MPQEYIMIPFCLNIRKGYLPVLHLRVHRAKVEAYLLSSIVTLYDY